MRSHGRRTGLLDAGGHHDGTVRIWRCPVCGPVDEVLAYAGEHVTRELTAEERRAYLRD